MRRAIKKLSKERRALREWRKGSNQGASRDDVCAVVEECEIEAGAGLELGAEVEGEGDDQTSLASTALAALSCNEDAESSLSSDDDEAGVDDEKMPLATAVAENTAKNARRECSSIPEMLHSVQLHPMAQKARAKWCSFLANAKDSEGSLDKEKELIDGDVGRPIPSRRSSTPASAPEKHDLPTDISRHCAPSKTSSGGLPSCLSRSRSTPTTLPAIAIEPPADSTPVGSTPDLSTAVHDPQSPVKPSLRPHTNRASSYASNSTSSIRAEQSPRKPYYPEKNAKRANSSDEEDDDLPKPGRYDTSSKKRVPSWYAAELKCQH